MSSNQFVQIHFLTSYPATLLNRDDAGFAKRMPFGGVMRTRISSQCQKRHWRTFSGENSLAELEVPESVRSRRSFEELVVKPLLAEHLDQQKVRAVTVALMDFVLGKSEKRKESDEGGDASDKPKKGAKKVQTNEEKVQEATTSQLTVLGKPELDFFVQEVRQIVGKLDDLGGAGDAVKQHFSKEKLKNLRALKNASGLSAALFGRMVTGDVLARGDAAVHVAHAITVHREQVESDYFSAVDDIVADAGEQGSGHINSAELTSGLYYGYVCIDVALLVSNLIGVSTKEWKNADLTIAKEIVERFIHLVAQVSPGAKKGPTAPYAHSHCVLVEIGSAQPRQLVNAFLKPLTGTDLIRESYLSLARHMSDYDKMYGSSNKRRLAAMGPSDCFEVEKVVAGGDMLSLAELGRWSAELIGG